MTPTEDALTAAGIVACIILLSPVALACFAWSRFVEPIVVLLSE
jgi:hypothetical protein